MATLSVAEWVKALAGDVDRKPKDKLFGLLAAFGLLTAFGFLVCQFVE